MVITVWVNITDNDGNLLERLCVAAEDKTQTEIARMVEDAINSKRQLWIQDED